jgi:hypothetical protein
MVKTRNSPAGERVRSTARCDSEGGAEVEYELAAAGPAGASSTSATEAARGDGRAARRNAGVRASAVGHTARPPRTHARRSLSSRHRPGRIDARTGERGSSARACACVCAPCCGIDVACMCECMCVCMGVVAGRAAWACQRGRAAASATAPPPRQVDTRVSHCISHSLSRS